jgi:iron complex transport system permease protein
VGGILALNGAVLQNVLANPLASSFTLGITQGAAFGACLAMIVLPVGATAHVSLSLVALCAFCGSILTSLAVMSLSLLRGMTPQGLILAGVAISALLGAGTMSLQYFASDVQVVSTMFWTFGDLGRGGWQESAITMSLFLVWLALAIFLAWDFEALKWGETQAQALGINTRRLRFFSLLLTALTTAAATAFFGVIGFVGLIGPHMVRLAFPRAGYMFLLPCAALFGGTFIIAADLLARTMLYPLVLPIGIICAFAGVPMFLFLLFKSAMSYA